MIICSLYSSCFVLMTQVMRPIFHEGSFNGTCTFSRVYWITYFTTILFAFQAFVLVLFIFLCLDYFVHCYLDFKTHFISPFRFELKPPMLVMLLSVIKLSTTQLCLSRHRCLTKLTRAVTIRTVLTIRTANVSFSIHMLNLVTIQLVKRAISIDHTQNIHTV